MKHKRPGYSMWNRSLALLMAVFASVQLAVPAYAVSETEPVEQESIVTELQQEVSGEPADTVVPPEAVQETEEATLPELENDQTVEADQPQQDSVEEAIATAAITAEPANIPGYTRVTAANLEIGKYYLIVTQDSKGKLYALYPDASGKNLVSGDGINSAGTLVADLTLTKDGVTAKHDSDQTPLDMKQLHFTVEQSGNKRAFKGANNLYLSIMDRNMLADAPAYLSVAVRNGVYTLKNDGSNRILDFNKAGDPEQYGKFKTNFWGPRDSRFPIYLYTKDGANAPVLVTGELRNAIENAKRMLELVDEASRAALQAEINAANKLLENGNIEQKQVDDQLAKLVAVMRSVKPNPDSIAPGAPKPGTTQGQPFAHGTGESQNFRIPAMITLKHQKNQDLNGRVVAAIDARWNHTADASGLDTIVSYSDDNGANWNYNYANFFNDSVNRFMHGSTAFIDPELVEGKDGTIYLLVDLFPGGVALNNAPRSPKAGSGYRVVDGKQRLVLYTNVEKQTIENWEYYVGDFQKDGFAPIYARDNKDGKAAYYVDDHYYLYDSDKVELYCQQLGSNKFVKQNVFFYNADLNVLDASYLWVVTSTDGGAHWGAPMILNPQVRPLEGASKFYGVGPGAGICTQDGTIMLTAYTHDGGGKEHCSFIYSKDGVNWNRSETVLNGGKWSSESCLVEIDDHTVRQFHRDQFNQLRYTDHTKGADGKWHAGDPVALDVHKTWGNQLSAVRYSGTLYGKPMIMVSTATGEGRNRKNGKIYTFALENDKSMTLVNTHDVNNGSYAYSSITELENGSLAVLYEGNGIQYTVIDKKNVVPAETYTEKDLALDCGDSVTFPGNTKDAVVNNNPDVVEATNEMVEKKVPVYNSAQGNTGTNVNYDGALAPLSESLFRFIKTDSGYQITATTKDGRQLWLSTSTANTIHNPTGTVAESVAVEDAGNGAFYLHCKDGYLYLSRSGDKVTTYDRFNKIDDACKFNLYRPAAKDEQVQSDIAGYVKVTDLNQIKDGDFYLITATVNGSTYVLNPSADTNNKYSHNLKLDATAPVVPEGSVSYFVPEFTLTAKTAGTADIQVGATIYHVTVSHKANDVWSSDASGHWHECSCGEKLDQAAHAFGEWTERKPATATETGLKVHSCTVCGYEETEIIPVVPVAPTDPEAPTDPQSPTDPEVPTDPQSPTEPQKPANPEVPTKPDTPNKPAQATNPQTGDSSPVLLWVVVAVVSVICIAAIVVYNKKKNHK